MHHIILFIYVGIALLMAGYQIWESRPYIHDGFWRTALFMAVIIFCMFFWPVFVLIAALRYFKTRKR